MKRTQQEYEDNGVHYSREIKTPKNKREGLVNAVQMIINHLEDRDDHEALMAAVDLLDDVISNCNPYRIDPEKGM